MGAENTNNVRMTLDEIKQWLSAPEAVRTPEDYERVRNSLKATKQEAIARNDQHAAKAHWCYEQVAKIQELFTGVFSLLWKKDYFNSWCELERIEISVANLIKHMHAIGSDTYRIGFIEESTRRLQSLFPYTHFLSTEFYGIKKYCGICGKQVMLRNPCGHKVGDIYDGEMCFREIRHVTAVPGIALVTKPMHKYSAIVSPNQEYPLLDYLAKHLASPYDGWDYERTARIHNHPKYKNVKGYEPCPCGSGKKFKKCHRPIMDQPQPHIQFKFHEAVIDPEELRLEYTY